MPEQEVMVILVAADAEDAIKPGDTLEERLKAAMSAAKGHWMVTDDQLQFKGAIWAVLESCSPEERARIESELDLLKGLAAVQSGVPVDMPALLERTGKIDSIGLGRLWREAVQATP